MKKFLWLTWIPFLLTSYEIHIWDGESYHKHSASQFKTSEYILQKFKFNGDENILDVGCGDGKISALIANLVPKGEVFGLDLSPSMIRFAQNNFQENTPNLHFNLGDACEIPFTNEFDLIFSFTALQWAKDHSRVLQGMHKALKPHGTVAIAMPMGFPLSMKQAIEELSHHEKWSSFLENFDPGYNFVTKNEYQDLLEKNGFEITLIEKKSQKDVYETKEDLIKFLSQFFPYLRPIPPSQKAEFMDSFVSRYLELEEIQENQPVYFNPTHLVVIAQKR